MPIFVTEAELDEFTDCNRTRRIVQTSVDIMLSVVLNTPGDKMLNLERLLEEWRGATLPTLREYRARALQRFAEKAAATESLG